MTRKDYVAAAKVISQVKDKQDKTLLVSTFSELFQNDNPLFDYSRFKKACGEK